MIRRILVPTDFSEPAELALRHAGALAQLFAAELRLLSSAFVAQLWGPESAVPFPAEHLEQVRARVQKDLDARVRALEVQGLRASADVSFEPAGVAILETAARWPADLIAMGTHGRSGLAHALLGSTAERCLRLAVCPVLTLRPGGREPRPLRRILVATDFSADARSALDWAGELADASGGRIALLHAAAHAEAEPRARARLEALRAEFSDAVDEVLLERGAPDAAVLRAAERLDADLIAVGTRGRSGLEHVLLGSSAERIVRRAPAPVAVVKTP